MSTRSKNALYKANITLFSQILQLDSQEIEKIKNLGAKSILEILKFKENIVLEEANIEPKYSQDFIMLIDEIDTKYGKIIIITNEIVDEIFSIYSEAKNKDNNKIVTIEDKEILIKFLSIKDIRENFKNSIVENIKKKEFENTFENIKKESSLKVNLLEDLLIELLEEEKINISDEGDYEVIKPSMIDILNDFLKKEKISEEYHNILSLRLEGKTLSEVGSIYGKTRERIRQIEKKGFEKMKYYSVSEDKYRHLYENYNISEEDFVLAFKEKKETYNYLKLKFTKKSTSQLEEALDDNKISLKMKADLEKVIDSKYFILDGEKVEKTKTSLIKYICKKYSDDDFVFEKLEKEYFFLLKKLNEDNNPKFNILDRRVTENMLSSSDYILWKLGRKFRYYDIKKNDCSELFKQLDLSQYMNLEISTLKLFRLYPELMKEYDIHDEYELHNLLKKTCSQNKFKTLKFGKMPMLEFGEVDRDMQILDLLIKLSPIKNTEFADYYEIEYGMKSTIVLSTVMKNFSEYCENSILNIEPKILNLEEREKLKEYLIEDFYSIETFKNIYKNVFSNKNLEYINGFNLNLLGYKLFSTYLINSRFESSSSFFRAIFLENDILDIEKLNPEYKTTVPYNLELQKLKESYELLEFSPRKYIKLSKLEDFGVNKESIEDFITKVIEFIPDNRIFTYTYLQNLGFFHKFEELGFEEYFYSNILAVKKDEFSVLRKYGSIFLRKGHKSISLLEIIEISISENENLSIDIYDLIEKLEKKYSLKISKTQILEQIRETRIHYSPITEILYGDYEIYYEEIGL